MGEIEKDSQTRFDHSLQHGEANLKEIVLNEKATQKKLHRGPKVKLLPCRICT